MKTKWTQHITDPEKKAEFTKLLQNSTLSLGRLHDIVEQEMTSLYDQERSNGVYRNENWAYLQAHTNGMLNAYSNMLKLLSFAKDPKNERPRPTKRPVL